MNYIQTLALVLCACIEINVQYENIVSFSFICNVNSNFIIKPSVEMGSEDL